MGATGLVGVMALVSLLGSGEPAKLAVGFRLQDHRGAWHTLDEARDRKVVVLAFLGAECPLAEAYAPRLPAISRTEASVSSASTPTSRTGRSRSAGSPRSTACHSRSSRTSATAWP